MRSMIAFTLVLAGPLLAAGAARAAGAPPEPKPDPDPMERICDAFGPGFHLVPGTLTCIKVSGFVRGAVTFSDKPRGDDFVPGPGADSQTQKPR